MRTGDRVRICSAAAILLLFATSALSEDGRSGLVPFRVGKKWGYSDRAGRIVIEAAFDDARRFEEGLARVQRNGKWGAIDANGREVAPIRFESLGRFSEGYAPACGSTGIPTGLTEGFGKAAKPVATAACGFIDRKGRYAVPPRYTGANWFAAGVAQVRIGRESPCQVAVEWGLVDSTGRERIPVRYCFVSPPSEGLVKVVYEEPTFEVRRFGFNGLDGSVVLPKLHYDGSHEQWSEGLIGVRKDGRFGFIDHKGRETVPLRWESAWPFSEGLAAVKTSGRWGFIDHAGKLVIPSEFDEVESYFDGLAWVRRGKAAGFIDKTGSIVIALSFDGWIDARWRPQWSEGLRAMKAIDGGWGFIDRSGNWAIKPNYETVMRCTEGLCAVQKGKLWGFVDLKGKVVVPHRYIRVEGPFEDGLAYVSRRLRPDLPHFAAGYIDPTGREFFDEPPVF